MLKLQPTDRAFMVGHASPGWRGRVFARAQHGGIMQLTHLKQHVTSCRNAERAAAPPGKSGCRSVRPRSRLNRKQKLLEVSCSHDERQNCSDLPA